MAYSRRLGVISILSVSWLVAVGCSDDGDKVAVQGEGGEAGESPSGGKATSGGSGNGAGKAGTAGKGGTPSGGMTNGGSGGNATAGTAGNAMNGGAGAGQGGDRGGAGGDGGASAGAAGSETAGAAGDGGAGGVPAAVAKSCGNECEIDADCTKPDAGPQKCDQGSHRCYDDTPANCTTDAACIPDASLWFTTCVNDSECDNTEACVTVGAVGYCALLPVQDSCDFGLALTTMARFGTAGNLDVCANTYSRCRAGACDSLNCADPIFDGLFCLDAGGGDSCNAATGLCECTLGTECSSGVCGADKQCAECATNQDCVDKGALSGWDVCVEGKCGCSSFSICPDVTAAGVPVCE